MKKHFVYALLSAIALTGAVGLTSCVDKEDVAEVNPDFDQKVKEVVTDFVFNISLGNGTATRMSSGNTQASGTTFRGITNANILTFYQGTYAQVQKEDESGNKLWWVSSEAKTAGVINSTTTTTTDPNNDDLKVMVDGAAKPTDGLWISSPQTAERVYDLNALLDAGDLKPTSENASDVKSRRVVQISLPTFTNTIMFYGKAARTTDQTDEEVGSTEMSIKDDISQTRMSAKVRIKAQTQESDMMHAQERLISYVLKRIVQMGLKKEGDGSSGVEGRWKKAVYYTQAEIGAAHSGDAAYGKTTNDIKEEGRPFTSAEVESGSCDLKNRDIRYMEWANTPQKWDGNALVDLDLDKDHANNDIDLEIDYRNYALSNVEDVDASTELGKSGVVQKGTYHYSYAGGSRDFVLYIYKPISWEDYGAATKSPLDGTSSLKPLEEILKNAYNKYTEMKTTEFRAGSGDAVAAVINDLYVILNNVSQANPTTKPEIVAKYFAERMMRRFVAYFEGTSSLKFKDTHDVYTELVKHIDFSTETLNSDTPLSETQVNNMVALSNSGLQIRDFPHNENLPDGSARLLYDTEKKVFFYNSEYIPAGDIGTSSASIHDYIYPAELMYFGNSGLRVSDGTFTVAQYPDGTTTWMTDGTWDSLKDSNEKGWTRCDHVKSSTRAVALQNNINYGTALLKTSVQYGVDTMKDNNSVLNPGEQDNEILSNTNPFILTGILVGGQPDQVGWDYLPIKQGSTNLNCLLYDKDLPVSSNEYGKYMPIAEEDGTGMQYNYTLVYDNYDRAKGTDEQNIVYVALEFLNTKEDFWGMHNMVRKGGKFYIIGALNPQNRSYTVTGDSKTDNITWPTTPIVPTESEPRPATGVNDYALPPYFVSNTATPVTTGSPNQTTTVGEPMKAHRVFIQDYMTEANFKLGEKSLQKAYLTVPDLRSAQISLGLSVDLNWRQGLQFTDDNSVVLGN